MKIQYDGQQAAFAIRTLAAWYERLWARGEGPSQDDAEAVQWILALARGGADFLKGVDDQCIALHALTDEERVIIGVIEKSIRELNDERRMA